jgi:hypothetical protein
MQGLTKGFLALCSFASIAILFSLAQTHAQSGVISGPPQVKGPGPGQGPGPSSPHGRGPGQVAPGQGPGPGGPGPGNPYGRGPGGPGPGPSNPYGPGPGLAPPQGPYGQGPGYGTWIAVASGFDGTGRRVSVGFSGPQRSKFEAESAAIRACNAVDRSVFCQNPFAVSNGCLYIVPGTRSNGGVRWGRGGTPDDAIRECSRGGHSCPRGKLIGGCVPAYR